MLFLPGRSTPSLVRYSVVGGQAFREGDIALGPAATVQTRFGFPRPSFEQQKSLLPSARSDLWPKGEIPYEIDPSTTTKDRQDIAWAVEQLGTTAVRLRPRLPTDSDYVVFKNENDGCYSYVGRIGGRQEVHIGGCGRGGPLHEVLHAAGFEHEHNRSDRDAHITMYLENASPGCKHIFDVSQSKPSTAYDTDSVMHYSSYACSRSGGPTMLRRDGKAIQDAERLSALDRSGIQARYSGAATPVPPVPNPGVPVVPPSTWPIPVPSWVPPGWVPAAPPGGEPAGVPPALLPPGFELPPWLSLQTVK